MIVVGAVQGFVAKSAATLLASSPASLGLLEKLGVKQASQGYLGVAFLIIALLLGIIAASQIGAVRDEEASGRLDNLLTRPVSRLEWLLGRVGLSVALLVGCGATAGVFTWLAASSQHAGVGLWTLIEAGLNATVPSIFVLGAGVLLLGLRPRVTATVAYGIVAWSLLIQLVGSLVKGSDWLKNSSLFSHIALAPAAKPDWGEASLVLLWGLIAAIVGVALFAGRDLEAT